MLYIAADFVFHCSAEIEELAGKFGVGTPTLQHIIDGLRQPTDHDIRVSKYRTKISVFIACLLANNQSQGLKTVPCLVAVLHVCRHCKLTGSKATTVVLHRWTKRPMLEMSTAYI